MPNTQELLGSMLVTTLFVYTVVASIRARIAEGRLLQYLEHSHPERYRYLTSVGNFWLGYNGLRIWQYLRSDMDDDRSKVYELKRVVRQRRLRAWLFPLIGFVLLALLGFLLSLAGR